MTIEVKFDTLKVMAALKPKSGFRGIIDRISGPKASPIELVLQYFISLVFVGAWFAYVRHRELSWSTLQIVLGVFICWDVVGGAICNVTNSAKRWWHRSSQEAYHHFGFVAVHGLHILAISWLFYDMDWGYVGAYYGYLLISTGAILAATPTLQRPVATIFFLGVLFINFYWLPAVPSLEWFIPVLFLKLIMSYLLSDTLHPSKE